MRLIILVGGWGARKARFDQYLTKWKNDLLNREQRNATKLSQDSIPDSQFDFGEQVI